MQSRRWAFDEMQRVKKNLQPEGAPQPIKEKTQIFVMMPLDIIAVGELKEGWGSQPSILAFIIVYSCKCTSCVNRQCWSAGRKRHSSSPLHTMPGCWTVSWPRWKPLARLASCLTSGAPNPAVHTPLTVQDTQHAWSGQRLHSAKPCSYPDGDRQQDQCGQALRLRVTCPYLPDVSSDMENLRCRWGICERRGPREYDFSAYLEVRHTPWRSAPLQGRVRSG